MTTTDTPRWKLTEFPSALLEHDGETCNEIYCASHDEAECLVDLLNNLTCRAEKAEAEVERLRKLLNAHAEFLIKNGFYRESRDLMGGSWSDGFVALAKKFGINPYDQ